MTPFRSGIIKIAAHIVAEIQKPEPDPETFSAQSPYLLNAVEQFAIATATDAQYIRAVTDEVHRQLGQKEHENKGAILH